MTAVRTARARRAAALPAMRALTRVELRDLSRHPRRAVLVGLLVAVPVAAVVGGSTLARIIEPTPDERATQVLGRATLRIDALARYAALARVRAVLPRQARTTAVFLGREDVRVPGRRLHARLFATEPDALTDSGLAAGMLRLVRGRTPANPAEVALSPVLLEGLGRAPGGRVTLAYGPERTITGVVVDPEDLDAPVVLRTPAHVEHGGAQHLLVDVPSGDAEPLAAALREQGFAVTTRREAAAGSGTLADVVFVLGTVGYLEAALVIAAAFAVSLRRRQYELGLLGAAGASPNQVAASVLVAAGLLALAGSVLGAVVGAAGAGALHPWLDTWNRRLNGAFDVPVVHVAGAVVLGVLTGLIAAVLPARRVARMPIRTALTARRPETSRARPWMALGVTMLVTGVALLLVMPRDNVVLGAIGIVGGPALGILGFGACSPWLLDWLARRADPLPLAWRLAVRDAGRFRARNGPVVTAVLAGMAMSVTAAVLVASVDAAIEEFPPDLRDDQLLVEGPEASAVAGRLSEALRVVAAAPLAAAYVGAEPVRARFGGKVAPTPRKEWVACGGDDLARALGAASGFDAFRAGHLLVFDPPAEADAPALTTWLTGRPIPCPATEVVRPGQPVDEPLFLLHEARARALGLEPGPPLNRSLVPWIVRLAEPVTPVVLERAQRIAAQSVGTSVDAALLHARPAGAFYYVALALCVVTGLIIVSVATALSAAESSEDRRTLHAVGASPRLLRSHRAAGAAYLALLGCVLAVPAGILPAVSLLAAANLALPLVVPWGALLLTVVGLPVLAYAATWLLAPGSGVSPIPIRRAACA